MLDRRIHGIQLDGCPLGNVFDVRTKDWSVEQVHFVGWTDAFANPSWPRANSLWRVVDEDDGQRSLEYPFKGEAVLTTADEDWRDYTVTASVRQMHSASANTPDDEYQSVARSGLHFRSHDMRQYYFLCLEGLRRVVLYHRLDQQYTVLAEKPMALDRAKYYRLESTLEGERIRCALDGAPLFDVQDKRLSAGKAGLRTNCLARYRDVRVEASQAAHRVYLQTRQRKERELDTLREKYPKPVLWKAIPVPAGDSRPGFGRLRRRNQIDLVLTARGPQCPPNLWDKLVAMGQEGTVFWDVSAKDSRLGMQAWGGFCVADYDGDGLDEVVMAMDGKLQLRHGADGILLKEAPLPRTGAYGIRGDTIHVWGIYPAQWLPKPAPPGFVLTEEYGSDGGNCIIALDSDLRLMWHYYSLPVNYGHAIDVFDVDGDGRDEVAAGYHLVNAEGQRVWRVEGSEYFDVQQGARHPDMVAAADFNGDGQPDLAYAGSGEGFLLVEGRTGKLIARHTIGHAQRIYAGKFRPDLPGIEIMSGTRWGNQGINCFFSGEGQLLSRFEPDNRNEGGPAVNWTGDGQELMLLTSSPQAMGLWDAHGRKVVDRWISDAEFGELTRGCRMGAANADLMGDARDEIVLFKPGRMEIFAQDQPFTGQRIFAPMRRSGVLPLVSYPAWRNL